MVKDLVSVIISTYNSSQYICETLDSVVKQTWRDIELIITDDCSSDGTPDLCRKWLDVNRNRFSKTSLILNEKNTGVSANANRGLRAATGEWIKFIGADDTLMEDCLESNMHWVTKNQEIKVLFSAVNVFRDSMEPDNLLYITPENGIPWGSSLMAPDRSADSQYKMLLVSDRIHFSPSLFISREILSSVGGFDERFRLLEDYPLWLNLTKNGHRLYYMDKVTVNYRQHSMAINNTGGRVLINHNYYKQEEFRNIYTYPYLPNAVRYNQKFIWYTSQLFRFKFANQRKQPYLFLWSLFSVYLNPFRYFLWINKRFVRALKDPEFYQ